MFEKTKYKSNNSAWLEIQPYRRKAEDNNTKPLLRPIRVCPPEAEAENNFPWQTT
jgi:hypothetical protein